MMDKSNFHVLSAATLDTLSEQIEMHLSDDFDVDYKEGVVTICDGMEQEFVLNSQEVMQEIWLSSPLSGGTHFVYDEDQGEWISTREPHVTLKKLLAEELSRISGKIFVFDPF